MKRLTMLMAAVMGLFWSSAALAGFWTSEVVPVQLRGEYGQHPCFA